MELIKRLSSAFKTSFFKNLLARKSLSAGSATLVAGLSVIMLISSRDQILVQQVPEGETEVLELFQDSAQAIPHGLSRQRKDFDKALNILASAANTDECLAEYFDRVQRRVKGESSGPEKEASVRVIKRASRINVSSKPVSQKASEAVVESGTQAQPVGLLGKLKDFIGGAVVAENKVEPSVPLQTERLSNADSEVTALGQPAVNRASRLTVGDLAFENHSAIQKWVDYYTNTTRGRTTMQIGIDRSGNYLELARAEFRALGVPEDLVWLAFVESVWQPGAMSPAAAGGIWQFIPKTATEYGLKVAANEDERFDPIKQTRVAATYLRDLHTIFGDWALAMAAYNCGEPRVMDAVVKNGRANFWDMYEKQLLPDETRNYVPKILAAIKVTSQADTYGFNRYSSADVDVAGR